MATEVEGEVTVKTEVLSQGAQADNGVDATPADVYDKIKEEPMSDQGHATDDNHNDDSSNNNNDGANDEGATMDDDDNRQGAPKSYNTDNNNESIEEGDKTNLIVNYLPQQMTDEQFETLFKEYGPMKSCKIVRNKNTGYSYGFGFADYETHEQALKAIEGLNGYEVDTKKIKVAFARPAGQDIKQANLYVKGVPNAWSQDDVKKIFEPYGQIIQVRVLGNDRGIAFVLFDLRRQAEEAMEALNGQTVEGCEGPLEIKFAADKKSEKRGNNNNNNSNSNNGRQAGGHGRRRGERGGRREGRRDGGRSLSNNRNNNGNNRNDQRRGTSQQGRGSGGRGSFNKQNSNNNNSNNNYNDQMNGGGVGPMRQPQANRMSRYAPFAPMQQAPIAAPPGMMPNPYGYQPQPMMQYMMPSQMMQMGQMAHPHAQQQQMQMAAHPMNPYAHMGYAQAAQMAQPTTTLSNMYNMANSTLNNAAQMQPQLGQPMSSRGTLPSAGGVGSMNSGGNASSGGAGGFGGNSGGGSGAQQGGNGGSDGITLFVYNIGPTSDESELKSMFAPYGDVLRSNVVRKTPGGETKGFGFVTVRSRDQANAAIAALNGQMRNGKPLQVSFKK